MYQHQSDAVAWLKAGGSLLHHGMGSGKSRSAIEYLLSAGSKRVLVCCPKAVMPAWVKQMKLWSAGRFRVVVLDQSDRARKEKALAAALGDTTPVLVIVNYDSAWRMPPLAKTHWDCLIWDEVHRLKSASGRASRWAGKMCSSNPDAKKIGLTGTLIPHSILDVMAIYRSVESPACETFGDSIVRHRYRYAVENPHQRGMVVGWRNLDEAHLKIARTTHYIRTRDVIDLPPIRFLDVVVQLTTEEARVYRELEREFVAVIEDKTVTAANALTQLLRLQQITGGHVKIDQTERARKISEHPSKGVAIADMLEDLPNDEPIVIFCRFVSDIACAREVCERAGRGVSELSGRRNDLAAWQDGKTAALVVQIQSGGIGIDLSRAAYCIFYSLGYSLAEYDQAVARLHRPGQKQNTTIYHLVGRAGGQSTVDGRVYQCLQERRDVVSGIIDGYRTSGVPV